MFVSWWGTHEVMHLVLYTLFAVSVATSPHVLLDKAIIIVTDRCNYQIVFPVIWQYKSAQVPHHYKLQPV